MKFNPLHFWRDLILYLLAAIAAGLLYGLLEYSPGLFCLAVLLLGAVACAIWLGRDAHHTADL